MWPIYNSHSHLMYGKCTETYFENRIYRFKWAQMKNMTRRTKRPQEATIESLLVFYWGLYPSFTALYNGCRSQRVTNSNQYTSTANRRPTTLYLNTDSLKSTKIQKNKEKKIQNKPSNKGRRIKRLTETKQIDSIRGDIHY